MVTKRIWELDALRGICILSMVVLHLLFDLSMVGLAELPPFVLFLLRWGSVVFLLISGICVTLGSRHVRRGLIVFSCGMLCTLVTLGLHLLGFAGREIILYFGVLHCLGCCMILWSGFSKCPTWALTVAAALVILLGILLNRGPTVDFPWLIPLGFLSPTFSSSDYFPLLPHMGYFLLGTVLGRTLYRNKCSLLPRVDAQKPPVRFLRLCGRYSLPIYLLHQPVITGLAVLLASILR